MKHREIATPEDKLLAIRSNAISIARMVEALMGIEPNTARSLLAPPRKIRRELAREKKDSV